MISLVQTAMRHNFKVVPLRADKDKRSRSLPIAAKMQAGLVYFREHSPWLDCFEQELLQFPNGAHDDMADAFGYVAVVNAADSDMGIITIKAKRYRNGKATDVFCEGQRFD